MAFVPKETESIDKLFLELSQFTRATTRKEIELAKTLKALMDQCPSSLQESPEFLEAWDNAVISLAVMKR